MDFRPFGQEQVTRRTMDAAEEAIRFNWTLNQLIAAVEQSWIYAHEDQVRHAKWEVEERHKSQASVSK